MSDLLEVKRDVEGPPGGWRYTVPQTGVLVTAPFYRVLLPRVRGHLEANGFPIPDDLDETVQDGACRETPGGKCGRRKPKPVAGMHPFPMLSVVDRFLRSVWHAVRDRRFVEPEEAIRRGEICKVCPMRTHMPSGCTGCYTLVKKVAQAMGNNPVKFDPDEDGQVREACGACYCVASCKVWLLNSTLDKAEGSQRPRYWEGCWRLSRDVAQPE